MTDTATDITDLADPATQPSGPEAEVSALVQRLLTGSDLYLVECVVRGQTGSRVVEVFVDADGGVDIDRLTRLSREVGFELEASDFIRGRYRLNVSSPGADRPLRLPRQYPRHVGRTLRVRRAVDGEQSEVTGVLQAADALCVTLSVAGAETVIPFEEIAEAVVVLPW